jgi:chorismate lyase / 3-hydroxybenzoate synthase
MEVSPHSDPVRGRPTHAEQSLPALQVGYTRTGIETVLAADNVLAVIGFGSAAPVVADPRYFSVRLEPIDPPAPLEIWRGHGKVSTGTGTGLRWASDGDYTFLVLEHREGAGGIAEAARTAYAALLDWCGISATPHLLRVWNYFDAINSGSGDAERYRQFCSGRAAGMDAAFSASYPAASAIGTRGARGVLQVYALAARLPGRPVANPRQWNAWTYPRQYGPTAPGFARSVRAPTRSPQLYISGTAAIVGHASHHPGDIRGQLEETLTNLNSLLAAADCGHALGAGGALKAYVRDAAHAQIVRGVLRERLGDDMPPLILLGDICRAELLVEIDGVHAG